MEIAIWARFEDKTKKYIFNGIALLFKRCNALKSRKIILKNETYPLIYAAPLIDSPRNFSAALVNHTIVCPLLINYSQITTQTTYTTLESS